MKSNLSNIGDKIKNTRKALGFTQERLAELANIDAKHLSKIENGIHYPSYKTVLKLSKILDLNLNCVDNIQNDLPSSSLLNTHIYQKLLKILNSATDEKFLHNYYAALKFADKLMKNK